MINALRITLLAVLSGISIYVLTFIVITRWSFHVERAAGLEIWYGESESEKGTLRYYFAPPFNSVEIACSPQLQRVHYFLVRVFLPLIWFDYHITGNCVGNLPLVHLKFKDEDNLPPGNLVEESKQTDKPWNAGLWLPEDNLVLLLCTYGNHERFDRLVWSDGRVVLWDDGQYYLTHVDPKQIRDVLSGIRSEFRLKKFQFVFTFELEPCNNLSVWSDDMVLAMLFAKQKPSKGERNKIEGNLTVDGVSIRTYEFYDIWAVVKEKVLKIGIAENTQNRMPISVESQVICVGTMGDYFDDSYDAELRAEKIYNTVLTISAISNDTGFEDSPILPIVIRLQGRDYPYDHNRMTEE